MDDAMKARIVEAGARAMVSVDQLSWDDMTQAEDTVQQDVYRDLSRACLSAALALAEQEGVIFTRVPGLSPMPADYGIGTYANERRVGFNQAITDTLAAKVTL